MLAFIIWLVGCLFTGLMLYLLYFKAGSWIMGFFPMLKSKRLVVVFKRIISVAFVLVFLFAIFSPVYYEFPGLTETQVVVFEDGKTRICPYGAFIWKDGEFSNFPGSANTGNWVCNSVTIRTVNPKVRKISYSLRFEVVNPEKYFHILSRRHNGVEHVKDDIIELVKSLTYDFNQSQSAGLEQLYNPLNQEQQAMFKVCIEEWMNNRLEKDGIKVKSSDFEIDS